jgi:ribose transport system permease protein
VHAWTDQRPWVWALAGCIAVYIALSVVTSHLGIDTLRSNGSLAALLAVISLGQMFAVSSGGGGIDLSIPYVVTLAAFVSMGIADGSDARLPALRRKFSLR